MTPASSSIRLCVNTIRFLSVDMVREGELGASRAADGRRADGLRAVDALPPPQPDEPALVGSRPLRPVRRSRLGAALLAAASRRATISRSISSSGSDSGGARRRAIRRAT